jgi:phospholipid/cholesterol/gamma-HCH transport system substrate-binding protein
LEGDLQDLVKDLVVVSQDMARRVPKITDDIESVAAQLNAASIEINALLNPENRGRIEAFLSTLDESAGNFRNLSRDLGGTREKADGVLAAVETLITDNRLDIDKSVVDMRYVMESLARRIDSVNQNLEGTARNMYEFSRQIRQNPGLLLGSTPPEDQGKRK